MEKLPPNHSTLAHYYRTCHSYHSKRRTTITVVGENNLDTNAITHTTTTTMYILEVPHGVLYPETSSCRSLCEPVTVVDLSPAARPFSLGADWVFHISANDRGRENITYKAALLHI